MKLYIEDFIMTAVLYLIMRNDIDSMNSGKGMAQASHASNAFIKHCNKFTLHSDENDREILSAISEWENATPQGFGTVLVLEAAMKDIKPTIDIFSKMNYIANIIHDPTYPLIDGEVVHYIPLDTCAYVFVPDKENDDIAKILLKRFPLHR